MIMIMVMVMIMITVMTFGYEYGYDVFFANVIMVVMLINVSLTGSL